MKITTVRHEICLRYGADLVDVGDGDMLGVALNVKDGIKPLNGLRHPIVGNFSGWYIWSGTEWSEKEDFFKPMHISHVHSWNPLISRYLGLAPGWRFLATEDYEDVWFDQQLLEID
jgi:hypothetical protein